MSQSTITRHPSRIAFVSLLESGSWGASEYLWSETALRLAQDGHPILACTHGWRTRPTALERLSKGNVTLIERFPPRGARVRDFIENLNKSGRPDTMQVKAIKDVVSHQPDLVLLSCTWPTDPNLMGWCKSLRKAEIPYAVLIHTHAGHNWPTGRAAILLANTLQKAAAVYFVSEDNRSMLTRQLGLPANITSVVRNPLAVDRETVPAWPATPAAKLACVGRLDPAQKGQDILLDCLRDERWNKRSIKLGVFGDGPARARLEELAKELPQHMVTFHGHVEFPATIWETHHLLVFPSRFEGLGLAVAEAQLCGRPVVITDCAARELVVDGHTGFIATAPTTSALQVALERAWTQRDNWPSMGRNAREHMLNLLPENPSSDFAQTLLALAKS